MSDEECFVLGEADEKPDEKFFILSLLTLEIKYCIDGEESSKSEHSPEVADKIL